jgi:spore coat protein CotH
MAQEHKRLTNLPHLYINTFTGNPIVSKTEQVWARMWLVDEQDVVTFYDSISIRGRGNSTWNMAKKPYRIKLQEKTKLLGNSRANAKKWTLLANHGDKTLMRNALASYIGDLCGQPFTPAAKFVDLTLNGAYQGCYQLSDQIDIRKKRVNIAEQDYPRLLS